MRNGGIPLMPHASNGGQLSGTAGRLDSSIRKQRQVLMEPRVVVTVEDQALASGGTGLVKVFNPLRRYKIW